jgi:hypothetical protein
MEITTNAAETPPHRNKRDVATWEEPTTKWVAYAESAIHPVRWTTTEDRRDTGVTQDSGNTGGDLHGRRQGRECEGTNSAARGHTQLSGQWRG